LPFIKVGTALKWVKTVAHACKPSCSILSDNFNSVTARCRVQSKLYSVISFQVTLSVTG